MRMIATLLGVALVVGACSQGADEDGGPAASGAASSSAGLSPDGPLFKTSGLWETTTSVSGGEAEPVTSRACLNAELQNRWSPIPEPSEAVECSAPQKRNIPGGYAYEIACKAEGMETGVSAEITGDARNVEIKMTNRFTVDGGPPMTPGTITMKSRHLGPCPADMKPGDTVESDGQRGRVDE
ncbi:DUF3617 family protein [Brevundimonas sp. Root1423]|uniref:DUF3617 domain-containing protein n=1 Tax=Brevundimonas sp. Root1423 TaxID=1736462 RepID=UPI000B1E5479|nr:DUF3617 family protein [Brevundimonas sp. Root1423]